MTDFLPSLNHSLLDSLSTLKESLNLIQLEMGALKSPLSIEFYENWLSQNYHGDMSYLQSHLSFKKNPQLLDPQLKSVISVAQSYFPAVQPYSEKFPARIALYAQNEDYHIWLKQKLKTIIQELKAQYPDETFLPYVDSGPILERDMAYQNGLGWFGKNTCIIHPQHGSLFFIAEILTSLQLPPNTYEMTPLPDFCGKCQKCIEVCPTGALAAPKLLKADLCISYLTIESKGIPAAELRPKIGDWFFGCDLCQTVCPWNEKVFRSQNIENQNDISTEKFLPLDGKNRAELIRYFKFLLSSSHKQIQKHHFGSPLSRAGAKGLKRNALLVIANRNLKELKAEVAATKADELKELIEWTLEQLTD
jgi:epoxyqueuosine reductase